MRAALVHDGFVDNVMLVGKDYQAPAGYELVELEDGSPVGPGHRRVAQDWLPPEVPEPATPPPTTEELAAELATQRRVLDLLLLGDVAPPDTGGSLDDLLTEDLPDTGGSLDDLEGLDDLSGLDLPDSGLSLDDLSELEF